VIFFSSPKQPTGFFYPVSNFFNSLNNLDRIQKQLNVGLKMLSIVGTVFSAMTGFYSFQFIITSGHLMEYSLAIGAFLTSVVSFVRLAKYSYFH